MPRIASAAAALLALSLAFPAHASEKLTDYSVQTSGDYSTRGGNEIYGKVAVGGNVNANADRIGTRLSKADGGTPGLIVLGDLNYANSTLSYGDVVYGGANKNPRYNPIATPNGTTYQGKGLAFDAMNAAAASTSALFKGMETNGLFTSQWGTGVLTATTAGLNVFAMTGKEFDSLHQLNFVGKAGDIAVINIFGSVSDHVNFNLGNFTVDSVLFNFVDATRVQSNGINWQGSILAPNSIVSLEGGSVFGSVVSKAFESAGATVRGNSFSHVPSAMAVPEPASWLMMILGFGLVGLLVRRRRRTGIAHA